MTAPGYRIYRIKAVSKALWLAAILFLQVSCSRGTPEIDGTKKWRLYSTTFKDVPAPCLQNDIGLYECLGPILVTRLGARKDDPTAGHRAQLQLYFKKNAPKEPLHELRAYVQNCKTGAFVSWLVDQFGQPTKKQLPFYYWQGKLVSIRAEVPSQQTSDKLCSIRWLRTKDASIP